MANDATLSNSMADADSESANIALALPKRKNRGWFRPGDQRINRLGRALKRTPTLAEKVEIWNGVGPCPVCGREPADLAAGEARELARAGRRIEALRLYRQRTGAGLAEAKAAIEATC